MCITCADGFIYVCDYDKLNGYSDHFPFHIVYGYYFFLCCIPKLVAILNIHCVKATTDNNCT